MSSSSNLPLAGVSHLMTIGYLCPSGCDAPLTDLPTEEHLGSHAKCNMTSLWA